MMDQTLKGYKQTLRSFMREHYTDERLAMLLAHAQSGRLSYAACCCFIGTTTADHALRQDDAYMSQHWNDADHLYAARQLPGAALAEEAFREIGLVPTNWPHEGYNAIRVRRLISIIKAEMRRRERLRSSQEPATAEGGAFSRR